MARPEARMKPATHTQGQQASIQPHTQKAKAREGWAQPLDLLLGRSMAPSRTGTKALPQWVAGGREAWWA